MISNRTIATVLAGLVVCSLAVTPVAGAQQSDTEPSLLVELDDSGDAQVTLTMTYDLDTDEEADAFESLVGDEEAQATALDRFEGNMQSVADTASDRTDRTMAVTGQSVSAERQDDVGVLSMTVEWTNFAATDGDDLVVTEPFASGYETDRPLTIVAPDGYQVSDATPAPDSESDGTATWDAGTDLDGFEVVLSADGDAATGADDTGDADDDLPGFGIGTALTALLGIALIARRH
ncbi:DUF7345 domain-containing protein [Natranaeroarchaeum aerophilus]|uniref:PGF-CTERM sorting domain-containing protein n=1 Tax=Natranaeroarchaeum aerophilus TaxID=2917711 RepID=A0AAE3K636_9EURY|nr:PGF-CTERM sorting domain-containing protein [Natranaeroarchaeum aerophilus]MCL9812369.1 PGF-CTERM sorting domain-containing protein [Natranaeroarchaeum aerophilus]